MDGTQSITAHRRERKTLMLVARKRRGHDSDFPIIAGWIRRMAPEIEPVLVRDFPLSALHPLALLRPTLSVCFDSLRRMRPLRGTVCQNKLLPKSEEYRRLEALDIPIPNWCLLQPNAQPDLSEFDKYVVVKPDVGSRGADVKIKRRSRVRWTPPKTDRAAKLGNNDKIVQQFIYTGKWPTSYRATTLFGKVLFAWKVEASRERRELRSHDGFGEGGHDGGGLSIASSGSGSRFTLCDETDVLALGQQAHAALPDHPLLGIDMVRDANTGKLYVVELNSCGTVWHFSSQTGKSIQRDNQIDFATQFDGLRLAAEALVGEVHRRAA